MVLPTQVSYRQPLGKPGPGHQQSYPNGGFEALRLGECGHGGSLGRGCIGHRRSLEHDLAIHQGQDARVGWQCLRRRGQVVLRQDGRPSAARGTAGAFAGAGAGISALIARARRASLFESLVAGEHLLMRGTDGSV